jgi:peroxiredoxin
VRVPHFSGACMSHVPSDQSVRQTRRWIIGLGGGAITLAVALGALPFFASRRRPAPDVPITLINGTQSRTADLRGQVVLMSFWSTTCAPCLEEMPVLIDFHRRNAPRGLTTIAVAMRHDRPDLVVDFAQRRRLPFDVAVDPSGAVARAFEQTEVTPTKFLLDREGQIVRTYVGHTNFRDLQERLDNLLAG